MGRMLQIIEDAIAGGKCHHAVETAVKVRLTARELPVLRALDQVSRPNGELCVPFHMVSGEPRGSAGTMEVRRIVRQLARKGLAEYHRGLFRDDGGMAGSGYCITPAGRLALREQEGK